MKPFAFLMSAALLGAGSLWPSPTRAALNPAHYQELASDQVRLKEVARLVDERIVDGHRVRRTTLVGTVLEDRSDGPSRLGATIVIDYSVDLTAREEAGKAYDAEHGTMPGKQFLYDPDPPTLDAEGAYWANLAPVGGRLGNVNRHAGATAIFEPGLHVEGEVYVPVAAQYSFDEPPPAE